MFNKPRQQKYGRPRELNYRYISIQLGNNTGTMVTSPVGHVWSIQFGDNHVQWSEANYYYSWQLATK